MYIFVLRIFLSDQWALDTPVTFVRRNDGKKQDKIKLNLLLFFRIFWITFITACQPRLTWSEKKTSNHCFAFINTLQSCLLLYDKTVNHLLVQFGALGLLAETRGNRGWVTHFDVFKMCVTVGSTDEAVHWVSVGHYEAVAVDNWWYCVSRGHLCLYILHKVEIWKGVTHAWLTHWLTDFER